MKKEVDFPDENFGDFYFSVQRQRPGKKRDGEENVDKKQERKMRK